MEKYGSYPMNAECMIDYTNKKVTFNYPSKKYSANLVYFTESPYNLSFHLIIGLFFAWVLIRFFYIYSSFFTEIYMGFVIIYVIVTVWAIKEIAPGYLSLLLYRTSKTARKTYPKSWSFIRRAFGKTNHIDLSTKMSKNHYIHGKKLLILNYSIVFFQYELFALNNKLVKVYTKSVEDKKIKEQHSRFFCFFEFEKPIKEGILLYK